MARTVAAKSVGVWLSPEQADDYQPWVDNARRAWELLADLEALGFGEVRVLRVVAPLSDCSRDAKAR